MSADRPRIAAELASALLAAAPARVRKKIDADPRAAQEWEWTPDGDGWTVNAGSETVRLAAPVLTEAAQIACGCLLSPRCFHLLAVVSLLDPVEDGDGPPAPDERIPDTGIAADTSEQPSALPGLADPVEVNDSARGAARLAWCAAAEVLATGVRAASTPQRAALLRATAAARTARLPRLAAACTAVAAGIRDAATPEFTLPGYTEALGDLLDTAWRLGGGPDGARPDPVLADVGVARRSYAEVGGMRLYGLASERVETKTGYAGAVTYLLDVGQQGRRALWSIGDVLPGGTERAAAAYRGAAGFGGIAVGHRELSRSGLVAQLVSASPDGRLSGGSATTAATAPGAGWWEEPLDALWAEPFGRQVERALAALAAPALRVGGDLVFAELSEFTPGEASCVRAAAAGHGRDVTLAPAGPEDRITARNLLRLAAVPGLRARVVARPAPGQPGTLVPIALDGEGVGRVNLAFDELPGAARPAAAAAPRLAPKQPFAPLSRALNRMADGGRSARPAATRVPAALRQAQLTGAADLLTALDTAAGERVRTPTGESVPPPPDRLALTWLAARTYTRTGGRTLELKEWGITTAR